MDLFWQLVKIQDEKQDEYQQKKIRLFSFHISNKAMNFSIN